MPLPRRTLLALLACACTPAATASAHVSHTVLPGETLSGIAAVAGVSPAALAAANGLAPDAFVIAGTTLQVPGPGEAAAASSGAPAGSAAGAGSGSGAAQGSSPAPAAASGSHLVRLGETLSGIAAANGLSPAALAAANGLSPDAWVIDGTTLRLPAPGSSTGTAAASAGATSGGASPADGYRVRLGDSLSAIAARHGVSTAALAAANGLDERGVLLTGTVLRLPGGGTTVAAPPSAAPAASSGPAPAPGRASAEQISRIAGEQGVPGSLAAAIAWQESGFNNAMRSVADARGVMQILPGTWSWIQSSLAGGRQLNPASVDDNVRAGSMFLNHLLRESGGDPALAAAGYYQGMASVRRIGMLPDTKQYVANVLALRSRFGG